MKEFDIVEDIFNDIHKDLELVEKHCQDLFDGELKTSSIIYRAEAIRISCESIIALVKSKDESENYQDFVITCQKMIREAITDVSFEK